MIRAAKKFIKSIKKNQLNNNKEMEGLFEETTIKLAPLSSKLNVSNKTE